MTETRNSDARSAVMILGMHRSGTSALAGVMGHLGCDLPADLMEPKPMNAKGFYESNQISYLNDDILRAAGANWFTWREIDLDWLTRTEGAEFRDLAVTKVKAEFGESALFVLKDPRLCLLYPFWQDILTQAGCTPLVIHTHRNPMDVAASLDHWAGYNRAYGLMLWLRYVLDGEFATRGVPRFFASYDLLMRDWATLAEGAATALNIAWPLPAATVAAEVEAFLSDDLTHFSRSSPGAANDPYQIPWVGPVYEIMERWAESGEDRADHAKLDAIRSQFNTAASVFFDLIEKWLHTEIELSGYGIAPDLIAARNLELARAFERIGTMDARLKDEVLSGQATEARLVEMESALASAEERNAALLRSNSWKLTAPFRRLSRMLIRNQS
jgi:hypothetical protein